jgi:hypothetical protein
MLYKGLIVLDENVYMAKQSDKERHLSQTGSNHFV